MPESRPVRLKCEYRVDPLGIDARTPIELEIGSSKWRNDREAIPAGANRAEEGALLVDERVERTLDDDPASDPVFFECLLIALCRGDRGYGNHQQRC